MTLLLLCFLSGLLKMLTISPPGHNIEQDRQRSPQSLTHTEGKKKANIRLQTYRLP